MNTKSLLYEYDLILLGKKNNFSKYLFECTEEGRERQALIVFKSAIEHYLNWTPEQAKNFLDKDIIDTMKLDTVMKYIRFPAELDPERDYIYIVHLLYPNKVKFNKRELVIRTYREVLDGTLKKYPKEYMSGTEGRIRALICLQYLISQFMQVNSVEELYYIFARPEGKKLLREYKLYSVSNDMYEYTIDFLHEALPTDLKNEFEYKYQRFYVSNSAQIKKMKKEGSYVI